MRKFISAGGSNGSITLHVEGAHLTYNLELARPYPSMKLERLEKQHVEVAFGQERKIFLGERRSLLGSKLPDIDDVAD